MNKFLVAGIAAAALYNVSAIAPVLAADMPVPAPAYKAAPALFNWTGFYAGVNGGGIWGRTNQPTPDVFMNIGGGLLGGTAGYNWQAGNWVLGIEGDLDWASMKATQFVTCPASGCTTKFDAFASARGRLGVVNGPYLFYATGGAAFTRARIFSGNGVVDGPWDVATGWTAGAGIEGAVDRNWSWKVEYLYASFGHFADANLVTWADNNKFNVVRVGLNYRFGQ
jgi:outer membrane immunogenic protein